MGSSSAAARRPPAPGASVLEAQSLKASTPKPSLPEALARKPSAPAGGFARRGQPSSPMQRRAPAIDLDAAGRCRGRGRRRTPPRPRRAVECLRALRAAGAHRLRRRLADVRGIAAVQDHGDDRFHAQDHHAQRFARHLASTARSIRIAAASTAASIASRGRRTPISACRPASISNPSCSPSRKRRSCWSASCRLRTTRRAPSPSAPIPIPISRSSASTR